MIGGVKKDLLVGTRGLRSVEGPKMTDNQVMKKPFRRWRPACGVLLLAICLLVPAATLGQTTADNAQALEQQGRLDEAVAAWRAITKDNPNDAGAYASLGVVLARQQKYPEAVAAYQRALSLDPKLPNIQLNLGLAEFKQGNFQAAIAPFQAAAEGDPQSLQARMLLGLSYYGARKFVEASDTLSIAAKADPHNIELARTLVQSCLMAQKFPCALAATQQILEDRKSVV